MILKTWPIRIKHIQASVKKATNNKGPGQGSQAKKIQ